MGRGFYHARRAFARSVTHELTKGKRTSTNNENQTTKDYSIHLPKKVYRIYWIIIISLFVLTVVFKANDRYSMGLLSLTCSIGVFIKMAIHDYSIEAKKEADKLEKKRLIRLGLIEVERKVKIEE